MVLTNFSKYHWPSQRAIVAVLTIAVAVVGTHGQIKMGSMSTAQYIMMAGVIFGAAWLLCDAVCHMIELASSDGYKLHGICKAADAARPAFLAVVAGCNLMYAADLLFSGKPQLTGIIFLHTTHTVIFIYILIVDWYIDNSKKLEKARYKKRG